MQSLARTSCAVLKRSKQEHDTRIKGRAESGSGSHCARCHGQEGEIRENCRQTKSQEEAFLKCNR